MITIQYDFVDKKGWGPGSWQEEPDKIQWVDAATGLPCLAVRHSSSGHWCGYVGVSEGHPFFGVDYSGTDYETSPGGRTVVHGGLTYAAFCVEDEKETGICHVVEPRENDHVWWFGFDCAHSGDVSPGVERFYRISYQEQYRTLAYVKAECANLAKQLSEIGVKE